MILIDTSVWIRHLREGEPRLAALLEDGEVLCHPLVLGELACGNLSRREEILGLLRELPVAVAATDEEVLHLIGAKRLHGRGLGWIDVHLLAAALLTPCGLWTLDRPLARAAKGLGIPAERHPA